MPKVAIFGAGIAGLACAHELSKIKNYTIEIYEKLQEVGGLARTQRDNEGCVTEICWRVFFGFYSNLLKMMQEIPFEQNKTTRSNLTTYEHQNINDKPVSFSESLKLIDAVLGGLTSCSQRLTKMDCMTWYKALDSHRQSNIFSHIGEWLGMDRYCGSYNSVIRVGMEMQIVPSLIDNNYKDFVTTLPTSEALFDPWVKFLKMQGVSFFMNSLATEIVMQTPNTIDHVNILLDNKVLKLIQADYYVLALPVGSLLSLVKPVPILKQVTNDLSVLNKTCHHMQLAFQVYFNVAISLGKNKNAFLQVDSPWDLIVLQYDQIYDPKILCASPEIRGGWSIAVCTAYIPGRTIKKPFKECTYEEIKIEIWGQLMASQKLKEIIAQNNDFELSQNLIMHWAPIWPSFSYTNGEWSTTEPKFTNNAGSLSLRPSYRTPIQNMLISTAYIRETIDIFSMEAACIAGKLAAKHISSDQSIKPTIQSRPLGFFLGPLRLLDQILFATGRPHFSNLVFRGSSLSFVLAYLILLLGLFSFGIYSVVRQIFKK
jgi:15-cis-phytoene desaturase